MLGGWPGRCRSDDLPICRLRCDAEGRSASFRCRQWGDLGGPGSVPNTAEVGLGWRRNASWIVPRPGSPDLPDVAGYESVPRECSRSLSVASTSNRLDCQTRLQGMECDPIGDGRVPEIGPDVTCRHCDTSVELVCSSKSLDHGGGHAASSTPMTLSEPCHRPGQPAGIAHPTDIDCAPRRTSGHNGTRGVESCR